MLSWQLPCACSLGRERERSAAAAQSVRRGRFGFPRIPHPKRLNLGTPRRPAPAHACSSLPPPSSRRRLQSRSRPGRANLGGSRLARAAPGGFAPAGGPAAPFPYSGSGWIWLRGVVGGGGGACTLGAAGGVVTTGYSPTWLLAPRPPRWAGRVLPLKPAPLGFSLHPPLPPPLSLSTRPALSLLSSL